MALPKQKRISVDNFDLIHRVCSEKRSAAWPDHLSAHAQPNPYNAAGFFTRICRRMCSSGTHCANASSRSPSFCISSYWFGCGQSLPHNTRLAGHRRRHAPAAACRPTGCLERTCGAAWKHSPRACARGADATAQAALESPCPFPSPAHRRQGSPLASGRRSAPVFIVSRPPLFDSHLNFHFGQATTRMGGDSFEACGQCYRCNGASCLHFIKQPQQSPAWNRDFQGLASQGHVT